jgi:VanZ like protein
VASPERRWASLALAAAVVLVLAATLTPGESAAEPFSNCIVCGESGLGDALANVLLFLPLGAALAALGVPGARRLLTPVLLSALVEALQATVVPGRDASVGDVIFNGIGGALGGWAVLYARAWLWPRPLVRRTLAVLAAAAVTGVVVLTGVLTQPSLPEGALWGQWTAQFANLAWYRGHVRSARLSGMALPSRRLDASGAVRRALLGGVPLVVRFEAGPPPPRLAPIFSIFDADQHMVVLVGANGSDLELLVRQRALHSRLVSPGYRVARALSGIAAGRTVRMAVWRDGATWCVALDGRSHCGLGVSPGGGWRLLIDGLSVSAGVTPLLDGLWMVGLLAAATFWATGRAAWAAGAAILLLTGAVLPGLAGLASPSLLEWVGGAVGAALGVALRAWVDRAAHAAEAAARRSG